MAIISIAETAMNQLCVRKGINFGLIFKGNALNLCLR